MSLELKFIARSSFTALQTRNHNMNCFETAHLPLLLYSTIRPAIKQRIDIKYIRAQRKSNAELFLCRQLINWTKHKQVWKSLNQLIKNFLFSNQRRAGMNEGSSSHH